MPISYENPNKFPVPTDGEPGWAPVMNYFLSTTLQEALGGYAEISVGSNPLNLSIAGNNSASDIRNNFIKLTAGGGVGSRTITFPSVEKWWCVENSTGHTQSLTTTGGATISLPTGKKIFIHCDGTNLSEAINYSTNFAVTASPTFTGTTTVSVLSASSNASVGGILTVTGTATFNGAVTLGDSAGDAITVNGAASFGQLITGSISGNAGTATALATGRTFSLTQDVTGTSGSFDGTGNISFATTIANSAVTEGKIANGAVTVNKIGSLAVTGDKLENIGGLSPGTYGSASSIPAITVDQKGRITSVTNNALAGAFTEYFESSEIVVDNQSSGTVAHGLSGRPKLVQAVYRCKSANLNYSVDDEVYVGTAFVGDSEGVSVNASVSSTSATHVRYSFGTYQQLYAAFTGGVVSVGQRYAINPASWRLVIRAWY